MQLLAEEESKLRRCLRGRNCHHCSCSDWSNAITKEAITEDDDIIDEVLTELMEHYTLFCWPSPGGNCAHLPQHTQTYQTLGYAICVSFGFGKEAPDRHAALVEFYISVYELSTIYEWQDAVLPMAIEAHNTLSPSNPHIRRSGLSRRSSS